MNVRMTTAARGDPLIGRQGEMERLLAYRHAAGEGRGAVVLLGGEAGVGKSRLLRAYAEALQSSRCAVGAARCVEFLEVPFAPFRESLEDIARAAPALVRDSETGWLIERLRFERVPESSATAEPSAWLFETIHATLGRLAQKKTIVLLLEDLHWADRTTLACLSNLAERIGDRRILVVATYRSDDVDSGHALLAEFASLFSKRCVETMMLARLDAADTHELIESVLGDAEPLDGSLLADIVRRSAGNPFFAEELVKSAVDDLPDGVHALPPSIRAAILARVDRLAPDDREILSMAAALGERFSLARLGAVCGDDDKVLCALERARRLHLVSESGQAGQLAFRHALTQEVLYAELLPERVRPLHERIGRELETHEDRHAVIVELAHHFWCAGDAERAARYCEEAGDRAHALSAFLDAVVYYERALAKRHGDASAQARLEHKIGSALGLLGRLSLATPRLRKAADLYLQAGDMEGFARNAVALGVQLYHAGDIRSAVAYWHKTLETAASEASPTTLAHIRSRMAYTAVAALDVESALDLASAVEHGATDAVTENRYRQSRFKAFAMLGQVDRWRAETELAVGAARRIDDYGITLRNTHMQIALDAVGFGDAATAQSQYECALRAGNGRLSYFEAIVHGALALHHVLRGEYGEARASLRRASALPHEDYATRLHLHAAWLALGICTGDDDALRWNDAKAFVDQGLAGGMNLVLAAVGGPYAYALGLRGDL